MFTFFIPGFLKFSLPKLASFKCMSFKRKSFKCTSFKFIIMNLALLVSFNVLAASEYNLGVGDKVEIIVYGQDDLTRTALLGNSGAINYPFLGTVKITGLSVKQVEALITQGLADGYLVNPSVSVQVIEYRPFYIHGEVESPGGYPYQPGMTINQAIALAGGLTERADEQKIELFKEADKDNGLIVSINTKVNPGDTITIDKRFF